MGPSPIVPSLGRSCRQLKAVHLMRQCKVSMSARMVAPTGRTRCVRKRHTRTTSVVEGGLPYQWKIPLWCEFGNKLDCPFCTESIFGMEGDTIRFLSFCHVSRSVTKIGNAQEANWHNRVTVTAMGHQAAVVQSPSPVYSTRVPSLSSNGGAASRCAHA